MAEKICSHSLEVRGGFVNGDQTVYHQHVSRPGFGLPQEGQKIITPKGAFVVEEVTDLGRDEKGRWGFNVLGHLTVK